MGVGKIIQIVAVLAAVVAGLWADMPQSGMVIAILGAVAGWFIAAEDRQPNTAANSVSRFMMIPTLLGGSRGGAG